ncbi:hypothetical protein HNR39_003009 [Glaciimonas immobilis]|uniref:Uncharacterized protein n=1 Tax=Glaciimonas immobilis TaxID=728004 RepID=A0A840RXH9_9BURK|nr:hypothetical protein [Glaciimonas immobilis]
MDVRASERLNIEDSLAALIAEQDYSNHRANHRQAIAKTSRSRAVKQ